MISRDVGYPIISKSAASTNGLLFNAFSIDTFVSQLSRSTVKCRYSIRCLRRFCWSFTLFRAALGARFKSSARGGRPLRRLAERGKRESSWQVFLSCVGSRIVVLNPSRASARSRAQTTVKYTSTNLASESISFVRNIGAETRE